MSPIGQTRKVGLCYKVAVPGPHRQSDPGPVFLPAVLSLLISLSPSSSPPNPGALAKQSELQRQRAH